MPQGNWFRSDSGVRWFFDAGARSLDFAYLGGFAPGSFGPGSGLPGGFGPGSGLPGSTAGAGGSTDDPAEESAPAWDGLLVTADLGDWLADRFDGLGAAPTERELHDARSLRDAIARLAVCAADGHAPEADDIDVVNLFAALPDVPPSLGGGRRQAGAGRLRVSQAMASVARDAILLFSAVGFLGEDDRRIKRCAAADCGLVFHDDSRAGTRRWCSMQKCGNRAKVRAHRARAAT